ncbi:MULTISPECIES: glycosyltransferase family 2 protein [unclassified Mesorhizobium]|uniref:glycosyltransferase n=1 Tax=unclassified Mesorhizobium TaxID=325217 RepID=UPI000BB03B6C|nr:MULTISPECIES: glycosyltransferase family 2 protein [unclassified Mesorhizobium]TGT63606.1 glycosyltransferase [Mesorhizobium sp. M00.F.Ca.ET.170.01.1.1]AZO11308.1 glycosyltransferase [Mesorhizobium sp. M3A.F.Ca.ET.080.04.2.1]PBB88442.1 glycosyl transferase family 2 [Mesorhizobium sp. WSM3876]RWB76626.1 MAG: glycosyltransferase [Mesorhizobium sp.]RWB92196.1 MAG: glycosyltransferase [Mesorhizobium sp.]
MSAEQPTYSVVLEMENARSIDWDEIGAGLKALARDIAEISAAGYARPKLVVSHGGREADADALRSSIEAEAPQLAQVADLAFAACPAGRYYELKNNGIASTEGSIVVFLDSDTVPERGWLSTLLKPFRDPATICVNGHTYLSYDDFLSRTFALIWFFPLAEGDKRFASKRAINANNIAFRRDWICSHPFPAHNGFKVSCTLLMHQLWREGRKIVNVDARVSHYPPRGWRFFYWRALVTGRDADRKFVELHSPTRTRRVVKSCSRWGTMSWRTTRRVIRFARQTGMPFWQIPFSLTVGLAFYTLAFLGHFSLAAGLVRDEVETVPDYVGHS